MVEISVPSTKLICHGACLPSPSSYFGYSAPFITVYQHLHWLALACWVKRQHSDGCATPYSPGLKTPLSVWLWSSTVARRSFPQPGALLRTLHLPLGPVAAIARSHHKTVMIPI